LPIRQVAICEDDAQKFEREQMNSREFPGGDATEIELKVESTAIGKGAFGSVFPATLVWTKDGVPQEKKIVLKQGRRIEEEYQGSKDMEERARKKIREFGNLLAYQQGMGCVSLIRGIQLGDQSEYAPVKLEFYDGEAMSTDVKFTTIGTDQQEKTSRRQKISRRVRTSQCLEKGQVTLQEFVPGHNCRDGIFEGKSPLYGKINGFPSTLHAPIEILTQVTLALMAIHEAGYIHGDIHLANIMVDYAHRDGREYVSTKLVDLGFLNKIGNDLVVKNSNKPPEALSSYKVQPSYDMWLFGTVIMPILFGKQARDKYRYFFRNGFGYVRENMRKTPAERRKYISDMFNKFNDALEKATKLKYPPDKLDILIDLQAGLLNFDPNQRLSAEEALKILTELLVSPWPEQPSAQTQ
jgi:serine/threonine protein kinase